MLLCCVYWCPFCVTAIWLLVLFILVGLFDIRTRFSDLPFISKHKHNHSPYQDIFFSIFSFGNPSQDIRVRTLNIILCSFTSELSTFVYFLLKVFFFSMPHEICTCEVKGTRQWRLFYGELSCVDVLVNITIVAVKCLDQKEQPW